jgi:hypothetical protein
VFGIFAIIAEFERELIRDRVKSGIAAVRSKGRLIGRPRVKADIAHILDLRAQGLSWLAIGEKARAWRRDGTEARFGTRQNPVCLSPHPQVIDSATSESCIFAPPRGFAFGARPLRPKCACTFDGEPYTVNRRMTGFEQFSSAGRHYFLWCIGIGGFGVGLGVEVGALVTIGLW